MKRILFCASIALALSLGSANVVLAQGGYQDPSGNWIAPGDPTGAIGWSSPATLCRILPALHRALLTMPAVASRSPTTHLGLLAWRVPCREL